MDETLRGRPAITNLTGTGTGKSGDKLGMTGTDMDIH